MKDSERMKHLVKLAKPLKGDKTEVGKLARKVLAINASLVRSEKKEEDLEIFPGQKDFLKKFARRELTKEEFEAKIKYWKGLLREHSSLLKELRMKMAEAKRKRN
jgi:hypothetical protein